MMKDRPNEIELEINAGSKAIRVRIVSFDETTEEITKRAEKTIKKMLKMNSENIRIRREVG